MDRIGNLAIVLSGDAKGLMQVMSGVESHIDATAKRIEAKHSGKGGSGGFGNIFGMSGGRMLGIGAAAIGTASLGQEFLETGKRAVQLANDYEYAQVKLEALTGSAYDASIIMKQMKEFTKGTPLKQMDMVSVTTRLMDGTVKAERAIEVAKKIGQVSLGLKGVDTTDRLAAIYMKVKNQGRFQGDEGQQLAELGFPTHLLATAAEVPLSQFKQATEDGKITIEHFNKALEIATARTGQFGTILEKSKATQTGRLEAALQEHEDYLREAGKHISGTAASAQSVWQWIERRTADFQVGALTVVGGQFGMMTNPLDPIGGLLKGSGLLDEAMRRAAENARIAEDAANKAKLDEAKEAKLAAEAVAGFAAATKKAMFDFHQERHKQATSRWMEIYGPGEKSNYLKFRDLIQEDFGKHRTSPLAARMLMDMQKDALEKTKVQLPTAAAFGSSQAEESISNAIATVLSPKMDNADDILKASRAIHERSEKLLDRMVRHLEGMKQR